MNVQKELAACLPEQAAGKNHLRNISYRRATPMSSDNLKDQIGLLLWFLCSPISDRQIEAGYRLLEILLSAIYERGLL